MGLGNTALVPCTHCRPGTAEDYPTDGKPPGHNLPMASLPTVRLKSIALPPPPPNRLSEFGPPLYVGKV